MLTLQVKSTICLKRIQLEFTTQSLIYRSLKLSCIFVKMKTLSTASILKKRKTLEEELLIARISISCLQTISALKTTREITKKSFEMSTWEFPQEFHS